MANKVTYLLFESPSFLSFFPFKNRGFCCQDGDYVLGEVKSGKESGKLTLKFESGEEATVKNKKFEPANPKWMDGVEEE